MPDQTAAPNDDATAARNDGPNDDATSAPTVNPTVSLTISPSTSPSTRPSTSPTVAVSADSASSSANDLTNDRVGSSAALDPPASPFHAGEQAMQTRLGKRDAMESIGLRLIRPFMPDQHRDFYRQLPFMLVGSVDAQGSPWASIVAGRPGFVESPDSRSLRIGQSIPSWDPLAANIGVGAPLGLLGIEVPTRRRNRVNVRVTSSDSAGMTLGVDQSFGNCPQYIQTRDITFVREPGETGPDFASTPLPGLDDEASALISAADTFFVSSYIEAADRPAVEGVDVSHRGGRAGFVKVDGDTLCVPDYPGNFVFNTMGNFLLNPRAGLLFIDFSTGSLLMLTGDVELLGEEDPMVRAFEGAERAWRVTVTRALRLSDALPFRATFGEYSPNSLLSGDWTQAAATLAADAHRDAWRRFRVVRIEDESTVIRSFYLAPREEPGIDPGNGRGDGRGDGRSDGHGDRMGDGMGVSSFEAGQYLTLRLPAGADAGTRVRTYTVSSAPADPGYRISVKREPEGCVSRWLHTQIQLGDLIECRAPRGEFFIDTSEQRPAVLLAGGVGITPMVSMVRQVVHEGKRTRHTRQLTVLHASRRTSERAFSAELRELSDASGGAVRYHSYVTADDAGYVPGDDALRDPAGAHVDGVGRITAAVLQSHLPMDDYDFYLCGPPAFMQAQYDNLRLLGVRDSRVFAESFGPASLVRQPDQLQGSGASGQDIVDQSSDDAASTEADDVALRFASSGLEGHWSGGDPTLLEVAEAAGLTPAFGCRSGSCGSCATRLRAGSVSYRTPVSAPHADDEVLICCAVPAAGTDTLVLDL